MRPPPRTLLNLLLAGALLRLVGLGVHPLWLDEGATWSWATRATWGGTVLAEANHPPAWWIVTRLWTSAFGDSEGALRAPAALLGVLAILLAWWLGRRLLDPLHRPRRGGFDRTPDDGQGARQALLFAGLVTFSAYFMEYAQEARMYSALIVEGLGLSLLYLRWLDRGDRLSLVAYALLAALALHTHYFAFLIPAGHGAHALTLAWRGRRTGERIAVAPFVLAVGAAGLLFVPWFAYLVTHYEGISTGEPFEPFGRLGYVLWRIGVGPGLVVVDRARLEQGIVGVLGEEWGIGLVTGLLWFVPVTLGFARLRRHPGTASFVLFSLLTPLALLLLVFPVFALIHERYLVFLAPWLFLLALLGAFEARRGLRVLLLGGLVVLLAVGTVTYHGVGVDLAPTQVTQALGDGRVARSYEPDPDDPLRCLNHGHPYGKEPWRQAHAFVAERARRASPDEPGDLVLLYPPYLHLVWDYYDRGALETMRLPREAIDASALAERWGALLRTHSRVFLILAHEETEDPDQTFEVLRAALGRLWLEDGMERFQAVKPILFNRSWGVRVAVFNRR